MEEKFHHPKAHDLPETNMSSNDSSKLIKKSQSEFLNSLSHDLKNPLHGILSYANFGIKKTESGELTKDKTLHYFNSIRDAGTRLQNLLNDVFDLFKLDSTVLTLNAKRRELGEVVQSLIAELEPKFKTTISFDLDFPDTPVSAFIDSRLLTTALRQLLLGLIENASSNILITISLNESSQKPGFGKIRIYCPQIRIDETQLNIFKDFYSHVDQTDPAVKSFGIKFAISQKIIAHHQGDIDVISGTTKGTVIEITLPNEKILD